MRAFDREMQRRAIGGVADLEAAGASGRAAAPASGYPGPAQVARTTARRLEWRALSFVVGLFLALRVYLSAVAALSFALVPPVWANLPDILHRGFVPLTEGPEALLLGVWVRWDANWYLQIARWGYEAGDGRVVFTPLFPALSYLLGRLLGDNILLGSLVVANVACLATFLLFYRLMRLDEGDGAARRGLLWLALFPTSFYLFAPYTESLYLALVLGAFLSVRTGRWPVAVLLGALAALTRVPGALLALPLVVELAHEPVARWWRGRRVDGGEAVTLVRRALLAVAIPVALGVYAVYAYFVVGDHLLWGHLGGLWELHGAPPWTGLIGDWRWLQDPLVPVEGQPGQFAPAPWINEGMNRTGILVDLIVGLLFSLLGVIALCRLRPSYALYVWLMLLAGLTKVDAFDLTQSLARYVLVIFPLFGLLGQIPFRRTASIPLAVAGVGLLGLFTAWFAHWWWLW